MTQKNFRRIPDWIKDKLDTLAADDFRVEVVIEVSPAEVATGSWQPLGLTVEDGVVTAPASILPPSTAGRYSRANREGFVRVRRDLPKTSKTYSWLSPNFGRWSRGSHLSSRTQEVYRRDHFPPNNIQLHIDVLASGEAAQIKVSVDRVLDRSSEHLDQDLFADLNLLQENAGSVDIFSSETTRAQYLAITHVAWELLPPGEAAEVIERTVTGTTATAADRRRVQQRMNLLRDLEPVEVVAGQSGFSRYFGAKFGSEMVILENLLSGNAIYVMYENWQQLSQLSRTELLARPWENFERIVHRPGWERRVRAVVQSFRGR